MSGLPRRVAGVQRDRLADLTEALTRAMLIADEAGRPADSPPVLERPAFLVRQPDNDPQPVIERLASSERLTFVVGAGASMEAGLASWQTLVRGLLDSVAPAALEPVDKAAWIDAVSESGLLGMAAAARALTGSDAKFMELVNRDVFRGRGTDHFDPGPLAREIAAWRRDYPDVRIATFNYDDLLERALGDLGVDSEAREDNDAERAGVAAVRHLHGRLTGNSASDAIVLTEGDYARWRDESWQDAFMREALGGLCVFVGLSFTDQNLLRWIYAAEHGEHVAVLARQGSPRLSPAVRAELENATRARLTAANVTPYWADFYAEVAQLLHEARRRRGPGAPPKPYPERAQSRAAKGKRRCMPTSTLFKARQEKVRTILAGSLGGVRAAIESVGVPVADAALGLGLWGIDYENRDVTLWGMSDRVHADRSTVTAVPLQWVSEWVAVEAITQGSVVERDPKTYASRWRSVRGIPLVWTGTHGRERVLVGAATLTAAMPAGTSVFDKAELAAPGIRKTIDISLHEQLIKFWD